MRLRLRRPVRSVTSIATMVFVGSSVLYGAVPTAQASTTPTIDTINSCVSTTAWQNAAHTSAGCELATRKLKARWTAQLNGQTSYPVLADGKVFVTTSYVRNGGEYGGYVSALSAATGQLLWGPIRLEGTYYTFNLTYQQGRLFAVDYDGTVRAFDSKTGRSLWTTQTESDTGLPVAFDGAVYLEAVGRVFKLDAKTGRVSWYTDVEGSGSSVAVTSQGVYVVGSCARYRLSLSSGQPVWSHVDGCNGGPAAAIYASNGRIFESIAHRVFSGTNGQQVGDYFGQPAFSNGNVYSTIQSEVAATTVTTGDQRWTRDLPELVSAPVVAAGTVWVGSAGVGRADGHLYGLNANDGTITNTIKLVTGAPQNFDANIAVGQGRLIVTVANSVTAYS